MTSGTGCVPSYAGGTWRMYQRSAPPDVTVTFVSPGAAALEGAPQPAEGRGAIDAGSNRVVVVAARVVVVDRATSLLPLPEQAATARTSASVEANSDRRTSPPWHGWRAPLTVGCAAVTEPLPQTIPALVQRAAEDRKSTRLNSSHLGI